MNYYKYRHFWTILCWSCLSAWLHGQELFHRPIVLDMEGGLSSNFINAISKDDRGFLWVGTRNGLCRYNGHQFQIFHHDTADSSSLAHNYVYDVVQDATTGSIMIGTLEGLSVLDPQNNRFRNFHADFGRPDSLPENTIRAIFQDRQGNIWMSAWTQGMVSFDPVAGKFRRFFFEMPPEMPSAEGVNRSRINSITDIAQDARDDSILWLATTGGLIRFDRSTAEYRLFYNNMADANQEYLGNSLLHVYPHTDGKVYLGSFGKASVFDPGTATFRIIDIPGHFSNRSWPWEYVPKILAQSDEKLWITFRQGLAIYDTAKGQVVEVKANDSRQGLFYGAWLKDDCGRIWHGTEKNGLFLFDPMQQQALRYDFPVINPDLDYEPRQILEDPSGQFLYVCVQNGEGLYRFDQQEKTWTIIPPPSSYFEQQAGFWGVDMTWDMDGHLLVLSSESLYQLSADGRRLQEVPLPIGESPRRFRSMLIDQQGNMWLTSRRVGVYRLSPGYRQVTHFQEQLNDSLVTNQFIWNERIFEDSRGRIWIRLARSFCIYLPDEDRFLKFPFIPGKSSQTYRYLMNFAEDRRGRVWIAGAEEGIGYVDPDQPEKGIARRFSSREGLISDRVIYLQADAIGDVWVMTEAGFSRVDADSLTIQNFGLGYGIPAGTVLNRLPSGKMAVGFSGGGVAIFRPERLLFNTEAPVPYLTSFRVLDKELPPQRLRSDRNGVDLQYFQNSFSFDFSSISYTLPEKNRFFYQLEGFDREWVDAGGRRYAAYTNVPSGDYTFRVRALNNEGIEGHQNLAFHISVATPWWQTWWFRSLALIVILVLAITAYRYRVGQIRREERLRSDFEKKLASVEMSALRAQMNPHFVFNCLNSIDYYILKNETEKASDYLNRFSRLIRLILQNSSSNYVNLKDELEALKLYMEMESLRFENKFDYELIIAPDVEPETIEIPPMLLQPYVENAIWHGIMHKEGYGKVELRLARKNGHLQCVIEDNGIGREKARQMKAPHQMRRKSMGMRITKDRVNLINRLYDSNTTINVIDLKDESGKALGTRVELNIPT